MIIKEIRNILNTLDIDLKYCFGNESDANSKSEEVNNEEYFFIVDENQLRTNGVVNGLSNLTSQSIQFRLLCVLPTECDEIDDDFERRELIFENTRFYVQKVLNSLANIQGYKNISFRDGYRNKIFKDKMAGYYVDVTVIKTEEIFKFC